MIIKACLFDLDGVIVDTARYHYIAWRELARTLAFDFTEKDNERLKGVSRMASLDILLEVGGISLDLETRQKLAHEKNENYLRYIQNLTPKEILPGAEKFLNELKTNNILVALGSASKNAVTILERLHLTHYFDAIIDGNSVANAKPDPEVFLKGAEALGVLPSECVVFEDAEAGIEAAKAGRMRCVGIGSPKILGRADIVVEGLHQMTLEKLLTLK